MESSTRITESDHISGKVTGWVKSEAMLLMAILCVGAPAAVFGQRATIYGQVILEDGTPVQESIHVDMVCPGQPIRHSFTGVDGIFHFEFGIPTEFFDASVPTATLPGPAGSRSFNATRQSTLASTLRYNPAFCEVQIATLPGFTSNYLRLESRDISANKDIGVIVLHRLENVEGTAVSLNTLRAPEKASEAYQKAKKEAANKEVNYPKVLRELEKATRWYPEFAAAWNLLGEIRLRLQDTNAAREAFSKAIAADSSYVIPYLSLARMELRLGSLEDAVMLTSKLLKLDPYEPESHYLHALANYYLDRFDLAGKHLRILEKNGDAKDYPGTHFMLGVILARQGNISSGAEQFRRFLALTPGREEDEIREDLEAQLAQWEQEGLINKDRTPKDR
jgi:tetratricopeptide (TPR) repeat protein